MTVTGAPTVSICMPVHNGENFIADAIDSIVAQTFPDFELIVTDNASTDRTEPIVRDFARRDGRIRYVRNEENIGAAANYNLGYELSRGRYVKWAAHDDTLSPNFLERTVAILDADPSVSIAFGRTQCIDADGREIPMQGWAMRETLFDEPQQRFFRTLKGSGSCFPIFGLFRTEQLARSSLHRKNYYGSDCALIAEMMILGKLRLDEDAVFYNRIHERQSMALRDRYARARWQGTTSSRFSSLERINFLVHLCEIARRHPDVVAPWRIYLKIFSFAMHPFELGRYGIEALQFISPTLGAKLRALAKGLRGNIPKYRQSRDLPSRHG